MSNIELNNKLMFIQKSCDKHEYVEVELTINGINKPSVCYQCKYCGRVLEKNNISSWPENLDVPGMYISR